MDDAAKTKSPAHQLKSLMEVCTPTPQIRLSTHSCIPLEIRTHKPRATFCDVARQVWARFRPAMHLTFLEHYPHPSTWYGKRLAYTRSAAVSSIVGYVMGIGDRHPQNIMFDSRTAELLHIDFGIAFEQVRK
jgi:hypothetical protein